MRGPKELSGLLTPSHGVSSTARPGCRRATDPALLPPVAWTRQPEECQVWEINCLPSPGVPSPYALPPKMCASNWWNTPSLQGGQPNPVAALHRHRPRLPAELTLLLAGHGNFRDGDRVAAHLARQSHRVTGMLLQSCEVLVADVVHLAAAGEYVFGIVVFHAGQSAVAIRHLLAAMLRCSVVLCAAHTVADLPRPGLVSSEDAHCSEHTRDNCNT